MGIALATGSGGLIGPEPASFPADKGLDVIAIDNDMRARFFGREASTRFAVERLQRQLKRHQHAGIDEEMPVDGAMRSLFEASIVVERATA